MKRQIYTERGWVRKEKKKCDGELIRSAVWGFVLLVLVSIASG